MCQLLYLIRIFVCLGFLLPFLIFVLVSVGKQKENVMNMDPNQESFEHIVEVINNDKNPLSFRWWGTITQRDIWIRRGIEYSIRDDDGNDYKFVIEKRRGHLTKYTVKVNWVRRSSLESVPKSDEEKLCKMMERRSEEEAAFRIMNKLSKAKRTEQDPRYTKVLGPGPKYQNPRELLLTVRYVLGSDGECGYLYFSKTGRWVFGIDYDFHSINVQLPPDLFQTVLEFAKSKVAMTENKFGRTGR